MINTSTLTLDMKLVEKYNKINDRWLKIINPLEYEIDFNEDGSWHIVKKAD